MVFSWQFSTLLFDMRVTGRTQLSGVTSFPSFDIEKQHHKERRAKNLQLAWNGHEWCPNSTWDTKTNDAILAFWELKWIFQKKSTNQKIQVRVTFTCYQIVSLGCLCCNQLFCLSLNFKVKPVMIACTCFLPSLHLCFSLMFSTCLCNNYVSFLPFTLATVMSPWCFVSIAHGTHLQHLCCCFITLENRNIKLQKASAKHIISSVDLAGWPNVFNI